MRLFSVAMPPFTTDIFRYLSDGIIWLEGQNPYLVPAKKVVNTDAVEYSHFYTIYPILSEFLFIIIAFVKKSIYSYKIVFGAIEILFLLWYYKIFVIRKKIDGKFPKYLKKTNTNLIFLFLLLNPLTIFEFYTEGHLDILSISFFIIGFYFYTIHKTFTGKKKQYKISFLFSILSLLSKFHGILLFPLYVIQPIKKIIQNKDYTFTEKMKSIITYKPSIITICFIMVVTIFCVLYPYFLSYNSGTGGVSGMKQYLQYWTFSQPIVEIFLLFGLEQKFAIQFLQFILIALIITFFVEWFFSKQPYLKFLTKSIFTFAVLFPVVHPWYYIMLNFIVIFSRKYRILAMFFMGLVSCNYINYILQIPLLGLTLQILPFFLWIGIIIPNKKLGSYK